MELKFLMRQSAALQVVVKSFQIQESLAYEKEKEDLIQADSRPHRAGQFSVVCDHYNKQVNTDNYSTVQIDPVLLREQFQLRAIFSGDKTLYLGQRHLNFSEESTQYNMTHQYSRSLLSGVQATHKFCMFVSGTTAGLLWTTLPQALFPYMPLIRRFFFFFTIQTGLYTVKSKKNLNSGSTLR